MKHKDLPMVLMVVFVAVVFSILLSKLVFNTSDDKQIKVEVVQPIIADFQNPDEKYFNANSVNPTQVIRIGDNPNNDPFNNSN